MIEFEFRDIAKIMELISYEVNNLKVRRDKASTRSPYVSDLVAGNEDEVSQETQRLDSEIQFLESINAKYEDMLNRIKFKFVQEQKGESWNQNKPVSQ